MGQMMYFGGTRLDDKYYESDLSKDEFIQQAVYTYSKIEKCKLTHAGEMPFEYHDGSCNSFWNPKPIILLCFSWNTSKDCHR